MDGHNLSFLLRLELMTGASQSIISLSAILGVAVAQTSTISLFLLGFDEQSLVASVAGADATATTYVVQCSDQEDECGLPGPVTVQQGPSTLGYSLADKFDDTYMTLGCNMLGTTAVACTESIWGSGANFPGAATMTFPGDMRALGAVPVVVTAGLPAATTGASPSANTATATGTAVSSGFATSTAGAASAGASSSATASGTASPASSSGGVAPQVTGNAHWAIGGVAAAALALAAV
ncbi:hypothetical protein VTN00DRAFT_5797 [Thermoascus crustaceus]|uniref:uncharacterized protein n=1 Tax=Thermoascus crustaceus TaxID=5088 RepID=UPI003742FD97